jgi:hypothetical protein
MQSTFSGDELCENSVVIQRLFLPPSSSTLLKVAEKVSETLGYNVILTWLMAQEDFIASQRSKFLIP